MCINLINNYFQLINYTKEKDYYVLMLEIMQLEELLAKSELLVINDDSIEILYMNEEYTIEFNNNRLVKRDGYQIMIHNISDVSFDLIDEELILNFSYLNEEYSFGIYKKEWWRN